jgi:aminoglycoside phosphotransferase (APT) family kinase protein
MASTMAVDGVHGDFHFANVLMAPAGDRLAAVVDWELATVADPMLDLGHLLATWPTRSPQRKAGTHSPG